MSLSNTTLSVSEHMEQAVDRLVSLFAALIGSILLGIVGAFFSWVKKYVQGVEHLHLKKEQNELRRQTIAGFKDMGSWNPMASMMSMTSSGNSPDSGNNVAAGRKSASRSPRGKRD